MCLKKYQILIVNWHRILIYFIILHVACLSPFNSFSQKFIPDYLKNKPITIVKGDTNIVFTVSNKDLYNPKEKVMYHYYFHREIGYSRGSYMGALIHGEYTCYTGFSHLAERGNYRYGSKVGTWYAWHENGELRCKTKWRNGQPFGKKIEFDTNGNITGRYKWKQRQWQLIVEKDKTETKALRKQKREQKKIIQSEKKEERKLKKAEKKNGIENEDGKKEKPKRKKNNKPKEDEETKKN